MLVEDDEALPSPIAMIAALTASHRTTTDRRDFRRWRMNGKIRLLPHDEPDGEIYVPGVLEELFLSRPGRMVEFIAEGTQYRNLRPGMVVDFICPLVDGGRTYDVSMGYYKVADVHHVRDTKGLYPDLMLFRLIWMRGRGDRLPYDLQVIYSGNGLYQFARERPDGSLDYLYDGDFFHCVRNGFHWIHEVDDDSATDEGHRVVSIVEDTAR